METTTTNASGQGAQTGLSTGGAQTASQSASAGTSAGSPGWTMPDTYKGKSVEDIARMHHELSTKFGEQGGELGKLRQYAQQAQQFLGGWDGILKQFNYDPQRAAQFLEQRARQAQAQGDTRQAQQMRAWADALTPQDQQAWLEEFVGSRMNPMQQGYQQALLALRQDGMQYMANLQDLALRAIQGLFDQLPETVRPKTTLHQLLQAAVGDANGNRDYIAGALQRLSAPSEAEQRARLEKEIRAQLAQETQNAALTTAVGAGGAPRQVLRPSAPAAPPPEQATPRTKKVFGAGARQAFENFVRNRGTG